ncbi:MAG: hypothetical protein ACREJC_14975, partial [Tepidisphaeraceae bacterium]
DVERSNHVRRIDEVRVVPPEKRDRDLADAGIFQVVKVRLSTGDWTRDVLVPFSQYPSDDSWGPMLTQDGPEIAGSEPVLIPGATSPLFLRLGNTRRFLPASLTLEKFELVPYDGVGRSGSAMMRDFVSTLSIVDPETGHRATGTAHMNNPVYFGDGSWLFFQAQWDPDGQRWTVLGVGNRPGVSVMILGCSMIIVGVLYAFYVKPVIVRRMKQTALENPRLPARAKRATAASADYN